MMKSEFNDVICKLDIEKVYACVNQTSCYLFLEKQDLVKNGSIELDGVS